MDKPPQAEIALGANTRLVVIDGKLMVKHAKMAEPLPIDAHQLERWLLRQLRELVV